MSTFSYSKGAIKAINLLKEPLYTDLFKQSNIPDINILLIFRIYLQSLIKDDKIYRILSQYNSKSFWSSLCSYFLNESVNKEEIGTFISSHSTQIDFSDENVYELYELCKGKEKMLSPVYFSRSYPTAGLFVFIVHDIVEYTGVLVDRKTPIQSIYKRLYYGKEKLKQKLLVITKLIDK